MYSWYKILCFEVQPGMWESDPLLEPFYHDSEYKLRAFGMNPAKTWEFAITEKPLPFWLVGGEGEAGYPDIVIPLTREQASALSLQWYPAHDEDVVDPVTGEHTIVHVDALDWTRRFPDA